MEQISECTVCFLKFKPLTQGDCICGNCRSAILHYREYLMPHACHIVKLLEEEEQKEKYSGKNA